MTRDFSDTYTAQEGAYANHEPHCHPRRAADQDFGSLYRRAPMDEVVRCHRNGQPMAGEAVPEDDSPAPDFVDGRIRAVMFVVSALFVVIVGWRVVAWALQ